MTPSPDIPEQEIRERCTAFLSLAAEEARKLDHNYIGVEHLFIAITRSESSPTSKLLKRAGLDPRHVRNEIRKEIGSGDGKLGEVLPLTPRSEIVLALTIFLAERDEDMRGTVDETHMLMAILQEGESIPVRKLVELGFDLTLWLQRLLLEASSPKDASDEIEDNRGLFDFAHISDEFDFDDNSDSDLSNPFAKSEIRIWPMRF